MNSKQLLARVLALGLVVLTAAASAQTVTVVEYYNKPLDAYFLTGRANEQALLDGAADFQRTGMTFQATAVATASASLTKICRFYISATTPFVSSHFYGRQSIDCEPIRAQNLPGFSWEDYDFAVQAPGGNCAAPIYRGFRAAANGKTSNHRYSASLSDYTAAAAKGYVGEDIAFCATSATPATAQPVASGDDCGTYYYVGKKVTYRATTSASSAVTTYVRTYDATPVTFNFQSATQVVDTSPDGSKGSTMIQDNAANWTELGGRSVNAGATQETYFAPPLVYPKTFTIGQTINFTRAISFNPATSNGNGTQSGTISLLARESVTAPSGTYANACKFSTHTTTQYPNVGSTSTTNTTSWVVPGIGLVRAEISDSTSVLGFSISSTGLVVSTAVQ